MKVLDFGINVAGPLGPTLLADLGAEVINVESLRGDVLRPFGWPYNATNHGKRGLAIDLKRADSAAVLERLVQWADIVHHNLRLPAAESLGIGYEQLRAIRSDIICCHVSAYGPRGPRRNFPGYDQLFQASTGWEVEAAGPRNPPLWHRFGMMDHYCAMASVVATLLALRHRDRTGEGQYVSASILGAAMLTTSETMVLPDGALVPFPRLDHAQMGTSMGSRIFAHLDGWTAVAADDDTLARLCHELDVIDAAELPTALDGLEVDEALRRLRAAGAVAERVALDAMEQFFDDKANRAARLAVSYEHPTLGVLDLVGGFWHFGSQELSLERPPPLIGEHGAEILGELGFDNSEIETMIDSRLIVVP